MASSQITLPFSVPPWLHPKERSPCFWCSFIPSASSWKTTSGLPFHPQLDAYNLLVERFHSVYFLEHIWQIVTSIPRWWRFFMLRFSAVAPEHRRTPCAFVPKPRAWVRDGNYKSMPAPLRMDFSDTSNFSLIPRWQSDSGSSIITEELKPPPTSPCFFFTYFY